MRLIDADRLIKIVRDAIREDSEGAKTAVFSANDIIFIIENAATAYDVDKVLKELNKASGMAKPVGWSRAKEVVELNTAIEIVKEEAYDI